MSNSQITHRLDDERSYEFADVLQKRDFVKRLKIKQMAKPGERARVNKRDAERRKNIGPTLKKDERLELRKRLENIRLQMVNDFGIELNIQRDETC